MKCMRWLKEHIFKYVDVKFLISKIAIFVFSGLISIAPIFFVGLGEILESNINIEGSVNDVSLFAYIASNTDFVYALVSISTIVLADVLGSKKGENSLKFVLGLFHILTVLFGSLIYAYYKTHDVDATGVESLNWICFIVVVISSFLSYINLAIIKKREEDV